MVDEESRRVRSGRHGHDGGTLRSLLVSLKEHCGNTRAHGVAGQCTDDSSDVISAKYNIKKSDSSQLLALATAV